MADGKKKVLVYADWIHLFESLEDDEAGKLIKHFFRYVNDMNPEAPDKLIKVAFESIKQTLKRDLAAWLSKSEKNSETASKRWKKVRNNANAYERISADAKNADSVKDSVSDNDNKTLMGFDVFWKAYPKKRAKGKAEQVWKKLKPSQTLETIILNSVEAFKNSKGWQKEGGQFIPYPAKWLASKGWEDEIEPTLNGHETPQARTERLRNESLGIK